MAALCPSTKARTWADCWSISHYRAPDPLFIFARAKGLVSSVVKPLHKGQGDTFRDARMSTEPADTKAARALQPPEIIRIAARDEAAFREAVVGYAPVLHRIAYRMTGNTADAEDIAQETMLRLWNNAERLAKRPDPVTLEPWLKRVAINLAFDRLRLRKRRSDKDLPERADPAPLADDRIEESETAARARRLVASLPERQRAALVLTYYEDLPNSEAAAIMQLKLKAFESLLHRARGALRVAFESEDQGGAS
jgi:RNA polymerase sigma-70 factor (ECF subfamily)